MNEDESRKGDAEPHHPVTLSPCHRVIVIGYGNELRGDDAAGPCIARAVAEWGMAGVRALAVQQLTPELAAELAQASCAIFVDAYGADTRASRTEVRAIDSLALPSPMWHTGEPSSLLALTEAVYGRAPRAWLVAVPAIGFEYGAALSCTAQAGVGSALVAIRDLIETSRVGNHGALAPVEETSSAAWEPCSIASSGACTNVRIAVYFLYEYTALHTNHLL